MDNINMGNVYFASFKAKRFKLFTVNKNCEIWFDFKPTIESIGDIRLLESVIKKNNPLLSDISMESYIILRTTQIYGEQKVFYGKGEEVKGLS